MYMSNRWGIPASLEKEIRVRDKVCVYCGVKMVDKRSPGLSNRTVATWEHIINDATIVNRDNIALCCAACNSSKGAKDLIEWLESNYCKTHDITADSVAKIVRKAM